MIPLTPPQFIYAQTAAQPEPTQLDSKIGECVAIVCALEKFEVRLRITLSRLRGPKPVGPDASSGEYPEPSGSLIHLDQVLRRSHVVAKVVDELLNELESLV